MEAVLEQEREQDVHEDLLLGMAVGDINSYLQHEPKVNSFVREALHIALQYIEFSKKSEIFPSSLHKTLEDSQIVEFALATITPKRDLINNCIKTKTQTEVQRAIVEAQLVSV